MDKNTSFFKKIADFFMFIVSYFRVTYYNIVQNITGKDVYKWQKFTTDFKRKYAEYSSQTNTIYVFITTIITIIIFVVFINSQ